MYVKRFVILRTISCILGFPCGSAGKESVCNVGDLGSIPGLGRSPGEENGYPFQYSGLENSMDCRVHGITKSWTRLSDFTFTFSCILQTTNCFTHSKLRKLESSCIFANLFFIWLNRRQLYFHIWFWVQTFLTCCFGWRLWRESNLIQICSLKMVEYFNSLVR